MLKIHRKILEEFRRISKKSKLILFGSVARGNYNFDSDIDLAIISDDLKTKKIASRIADKILFKYGKLVSIHFFNRKNFLKRIKEKDPFVLEIKRGKVI